jgi:hypothetical protein
VPSASGSSPRGDPQGKGSEKRNTSHNGAYKIKVVAGAVRQTPSHIWEQVETLSDVRKQHNHKTSRAKKEQPGLEGEHR